MWRWMVVALSLSMVVLIIACGGTSREEPDSQDSTSAARGSLTTESTVAPGALPVPQATPTPAPAPVAEPTKGSPGFGFESGVPSDAVFPQEGPAPALPPSPDETSVQEDRAVSVALLETADRQVISIASMAVEVENVPQAVNQVRSAAESLGGFVEQLSSSGDPEKAQATMTVRVPQPQFFQAMDRISALGKVKSQSVGSEDVTEQFIDLEARLTSLQRQEESLLRLLEKATSVTEILSLERELARVRSEIERIQGQINFLERRVEFATINVSLFPPQEEVTEPPSASLAMAVPQVVASADRIKATVTSVGGVVDRSFVSGSKGNERATLAVRVFSKDFTDTLASIEHEGDVTSREVREGTGPTGDTGKAGEVPNSRIDISLVVQQPSEPPAAALTLSSSKVVEVVDAIKQRVATAKGVVDRATITTSGGADNAFVSLRVDRDQFLTVLSFVEGQGQVLARELREGSPPKEGQAGASLEPDARMEVSIREKEDQGLGTGTIIAITAPTGGVAFLIVAGAIMIAVYRAGRRSQTI